MIFDLSTPAAPLMPQPKIRCNWLFCHLLAQKAMSPANMTIANPSQNNRETLFNYDKQFFADSDDLFAFNQWVIGYPGFIDNYEYRGIKTEDYSKWISSSYQRNKGIDIQPGIDRQPGKSTTVGGIFHYKQKNSLSQSLIIGIMADRQESSLLQAWVCPSFMKMNPLELSVMT